MENIVKLVQRTNRKNSPMEKPKFFFNGYPVYKNYYLISENIEWEEFLNMVDYYLWLTEASENELQLAALRTAETDLDKYDSDVYVSALYNYEFEKKEFISLVNDGVIGELPC